MKPLLLTILPLLYLTTVYPAATGNTKPFRMMADWLEQQEEDFDFFSDEALKRLAIERGVIPADADLNYVQEQSELKNSFHVWLLVSRDHKIILVGGLKNLCKEQNGATIHNSSEFYVDRLNEVIYDNLLNESFERTTGTGLKDLLIKTALIFDDFDNGKGKVETLKDYLGGEKFNEFIESYPYIYDRLVEIDNAMQ